MRSSFHEPTLSVRRTNPVGSKILLAVFAVCLAFFSSDARTSEIRNAIVFLVDDMGWTDLGCYGSDLYETPNIDALAASGVKFTNAYAACTVCSPTRAALLTGQYPARIHVTDFIPGHPFVNTPMSIPEWTKVLEHRHLTIAELLQEKGWKTAHFGKWHLTHRNRKGPGGTDDPDPDFYPTTHGFDFNIGGNEHGAPPSYFWPYGRGKTLEEKKQNTIFKTLPEGGSEGEYLTDRLADECVKLIDQLSQGGDPMFIYFPFYNVHTPLQGPPDLVKKYEAKLKANRGLKHHNAIYAAMVESVDNAIGKVLGQLEKSGKADETLIIFSSDNGGLRPKVTSNEPLRQGKGGIYEGGVRVPTMIRWPGVTQPQTVCDEPIITMDFFPTVCEALGVDQSTAIDGLSLKPLLENPGSTLNRDAIFWHYPHYHSMGAQPYSAVRSGDWKLIEILETGSLELYHLAEDIHEDHNLAEKNPAKAQELFKILDSWRKEVGAQMAVKNEEYDPAKPTGVSRGARIQKQTPIRE